MYSFFRRLGSYVSRDYRFLFIVFAIFGGSIFGVYLAIQSSETILPLMRAAVGSRMSIVGVIASRFLPFLFAAFAVYLAKPWLLIPVFIIKGFAISWIGCLVAAAFGSAGWLVQPLFQFSELLLMPVLCWFSIRNISESRVSFWIHDFLRFL